MLIITTNITITMLTKMSMITVTSEIPTLFFRLTWTLARSTCVPPSSILSCLSYSLPSPPTLPFSRVPLHPIRACRSLPLNAFLLFCSVREGGKTASGCHLITALSKEPAKWADLSISLSACICNCVSVFSFFGLHKNALKEELLFFFSKVYIYTPIMHSHKLKHVYQ